MMRFLWLSLLLWMLVPRWAKAQHTDEKELRQWFRQQKIEDGTVKLTLPGWIVRLAVNSGGKEDGDESDIWLRQAVKHLRNIQILTLENPSATRQQRILAMANRPDLQPLITVHSEGTHIRIAMRQKMNKHHRIKQLFILVSSDEELVWCNLRGNWIAGDWLKRLFSKDGMTHLFRFNKKMFG